MSHEFEKRFAGENTEFVIFREGEEENPVVVDEIVLATGYTSYLDHMISDLSLRKENWD